MKPLNFLTRFIIPLGIIIISYYYLGPIAGIVAFLVFFSAALYSLRAYLYANQATNKYNRGDFKGALTIMKKAADSDQKAFRVRGIYAYLLLKLGHTEEADTQIEIALKGAQTQNDKNNFLMTKSLVLWKQGKLDESISILSDLIKVYETTGVYASLGFLYIAKGDLQQALEFNLKAREYNGKSAIILDNLGTTYILLEEYDKASEVYKEVMKLNPQFPEAYYNFARVLDHEGNTEKALKMANHSLSMSFWNISTIQKGEVEAFLSKLETKNASAKPANAGEINAPENK